MTVTQSAEARLRPRSLWFLVFGAWSAFGLVNGTLWGVATSPNGLALKWTYPTALTVAWAWALATPLIFLATRLWRPARVGWAVSIASHAMLGVACAVAATLIRNTAFHYFSGLKPDPFSSALVYWIDVWLFVYLTLVVIGRALYLRRRYTDRTMRADLLEAQLARAQLQYLESQLQPHFLFNALNTIQELAYEAPKAAERMLVRLRTLLAMSLERYGQDEVSLADELDGLEPYLDIQRTRFSNWLSVHLDVPERLRTARVPRLVLQPLVENAIRHGLAVRQAPGRVEIMAEQLGDRLRLTVRDDGVGLRPEARRGRTSGGIGLQNVSERLKQLYGSEQRFDLRPREGGGAEVELEIPYREAERVDVREEPAAEDSVDVTAWATGEYRSNGEEMGVDPGPDEAPVRVEQDSPRLSTRAWLGIAGVWIILAVFWTNQMALYMSRRFPGPERDYSLWSLARLQIATSVIWLGLSLPVLWGARRFRLTPTNWPLRLPFHVAAAVACGFIHVETMFRLGITSMPALSYTNLNPITGDFFIYFALLAWSHSRDFVAWFRARDLEATRLSAEVARSRFQALRVQLRPDFLDATLGHLAELVHRDVDRAERLITRLADTLRLTLELSRQPTASVAQEIDLVVASIEAHRLGVRPGVRLTKSVSTHVLSEDIPSRLICTVVDELLANVPGTASEPLTIEVEAHDVSGCTQILVRARTAAAPVGTHLWWRTNGIAERAIKTSDSQVTVLIPDRSSVMLMIGNARASAELEAPYEVVGATS
jgi:two-component system, LytTR family, sensor kinase